MENSAGFGNMTFNKHSAMVLGEIRRFEDLESWQKARKLVGAIYQQTRQAPFAKDFGLRDQIQRASVSVMSNIAEGFERGSNKDFAKFVFVAKASAGEVRSLLYVARDLEYISSEDFEKLREHCISVSQLCWGLIRHLQRNSGWKTGTAISFLMLAHSVTSFASA